jgi:hypothetical protein
VRVETDALSTGPLGRRIAGDPAAPILGATPAEHRPARSGLLVGEVTMECDGTPVSIVRTLMSRGTGKASVGERSSR